MPGFIVGQNATVQCGHMAKCQPTALQPRVQVSGFPVVLSMATPQYSVVGCPNPPPNASNGPCATAAFSSAAARVLAGGIPVLLSNGSPGNCVPTGVPATIVQTQIRVTAT